MRKLIVSTFVSLDGVMQAPGGPEEDANGKFAHGGWTFPFWGEEELEMDGLDGQNRELLLGRRTYEIFEAYWPYQPADHPIAKTFNATRKHVASRTLKAPLEWANSTLLGGDVPARVAALKAQPGLDLQVIGSAQLVQTLQAESLVDEYNVWTYPVLLGRGKRLFESTLRPEGLRLVKTSASSKGVVMSTYAPAGEVRVGSFEDTTPSAKELARRERAARGEW